MTAVPQGAPTARSSSVFNLVAEEGTNVYLFVGGREEMRRLNSK